MIQYLHFFSGTQRKSVTLNVSGKRFMLNSEKEAGDGEFYLVS